MKLRLDDLDLARDDSTADPNLADPPSGRWTPATLLEHLHDELARYDVTLKPKVAKTGRFARLTTTYYQHVRVPEDWDERGTLGQVLTLAHELVHVRQWRKYGRARFGGRYVFSPRWRWAMEVQAYRESIRVRKVLGMGKGEAEQYAGRVAARMWTTYRLWPLSKAHVRKYAKMLMLEVYG